jgi:hypothetical protein
VELGGIELPADFPLTFITRLWQITRLNGQAIADDFELLAPAAVSRYRCQIPIR